MMAELQSKNPLDPTLDYHQDSEFKKLLQVVRADSMLSESGFYSLYRNARQICEDDQPGNFMVCGVAIVGVTALLAYVLKKYTRQPRKCIVVVVSQDDLTMEAQQKNGSQQAAESVTQICTRLNVQDVVTLYEGEPAIIFPGKRDWFGMISLLHVCDFGADEVYSTLLSMYDRLVEVGFVQLVTTGCQTETISAVSQFEQEQRCEISLNKNDSEVWFTKSDAFGLNPIYPTSLLTEFEKLDPIQYKITTQMSRNERFQLFYVLSDLVSRTKQLTRFIELGSYAGASLFMTAHALCRNGHEIQGFSVDPGNHPQLGAVLQNLQPRVTFLNVYSHQAVGRLREFFERDGNFPQFIFVDGDHTYEGVKRDIQDYFPLLAPGGIIGFHDFLPAVDNENREIIYHHHGGKEPGIRQACIEMMEETYHCKALEVPIPYPTNPAQTQAQLPIIPGVFSTLRFYRKEG